MSQIKLPNYQDSKNFVISPEGLQNLLLKKRDPNCPGRNLVWTDDFKCELPIKLGKEGVSAYTPTTLIDEFRAAVVNYGSWNALAVKKGNKWHTINYRQYYEQCIRFAKALIAYDIQEYTSININGFNSPEWFITFLGSLFCRCLPVGIYTNNNVAACQYIAEHSECKVVVVDTREQAVKYLPLLRKKEIALVIVYNDQSYQEAEFPQRIIQWNKFLSAGDRVDAKFLEERMSKVKPGHCCTLVYTSGTTGMPKGVMLSHDNYTWTAKSLREVRERDRSLQLQIISYLPLSHVAGQYTDIIVSLSEGNLVYFADSTALQGTIINSMKQVRPMAFMSVPRVWEKIYDEMMKVAKSNGFIKTKIANWAKSLGEEGTLQEMQDKPTSWQFKLAKVLVYNNVKKALGLDRCNLCFFGAAPLDPVIRSYFLSLNIFLINGYGMSESTGPQNMTNQLSLEESLKADRNTGFRQAGRPMPGTQLKIVKQNDKDDDGQICYRGRNTFMGYYKNPEQSAKTIDEEGFLHSGDNGKLDKFGTLFITGRSKELIITAGGENIPPILIENQIKSALPCVANSMVIGDMRKYLSCFITLRENPIGSGQLDEVAQSYFSLKGVEVKTVKEARSNPKVKKIIGEGVKKANDKAISKAQVIQEFDILPEDFTVQNGLLTPTLKLKRKQVLKKYAVEVQQLYTTAKL